MNVYQIKQFDIHGNPQVYWAVYRGRTEYVFGTYSAAKTYADSWA